MDGLIDGRVGEGRADLANLKGKAAIANAKLAYQAFKGTFGGDRFTELRSAGAMVQRPLWASTSTKDPSYSDVMYIESLIGRDTVNTLPDATLDAFVDHGAASETLDRDADAARDAVESLEAAGISMDAFGRRSQGVCERLRSARGQHRRQAATVDRRRLTGRSRVTRSVDVLSKAKCSRQPIRGVISMVRSASIELTYSGPCRQASISGLRLAAAKKCIGGNVGVPSHRRPRSDRQHSHGGARGLGRRNRLVLLS